MRTFIALSALLLAFVPAQAQFSGQRIVPLGYQQLTSIAASTALTVPAGATCALLQAEGQIVRLRDDGTAPTASVGVELAVGAVPFPYCGALSAILVIQATSGGILNVLYYRLAG